ncbi:MAG TPA: hypothetical protein VKF60_07350 [Myxococcota bacterium]|nr:hypothetical protein [Myxococcota bacterium]
MLNEVPVAQGGPLPKLEVDGLCGPQTIDKIQKFQLAHFGWSGADGRVDPGGPTHAKLNEFDDKGPREPDPVTTDTALVCPHGAAVVGTSLRGTRVLRSNDTFVVPSCPLPRSPCVRVQWISPPLMPGRSLDARSLGMCVSAEGFPQGPVLIR